jgi:hypothetical protein
MTSRLLLKIMSRWKHIATGSFYTVLGIGTCSTNGEREHKEESVIYWSDTHQHWCYREVDEFLDGRFIPVDDKGNEIHIG